MDLSSLSGLRRVVVTFANETCADSCRYPKLGSRVTPNRGGPVRADRVTCLSGGSSGRSEAAAAWQVAAKKAADPTLTIHTSSVNRSWRQRSLVPTKQGPSGPCPPGLTHSSGPPIPRKSFAWRTGRRRHRSHFRPEIPVAPTLCNQWHIGKAGLANRNKSPLDTS